MIISGFDRDRDTSYAFSGNDPSVFIFNININFVSSLYHFFLSSLSSVFFTAVVINLDFIW